jgi:hypothetical protein
LGTLIQRRRNAVGLWSNLPKRLILRVDGVNRRAIAAVDLAVSDSFQAIRTRRYASSRHAPAKTTLSNTAIRRALLQQMPQHDA